MQDENNHKLNLFLCQLGELIKEPPTVLNYYDWKSNIDYLMQEIHDVSDATYEKFNDLVAQVMEVGEEHVYFVDSDEPPNVISRSMEQYFKQVSYLTSEINSLKPF